MMKNDQQDSGAQGATADVAAGNVGAGQLPHVAHTPGPWRIGSWCGQCHNPLHVAARRHPGAPECVYDQTFQESNYGIAGPQPGQMVVDTHYDELVISEADAHLIAAAPDYHQAMTECLKPNHGYNIEYVSIPLTIWKRFLAAHAKAEGR